MVRFCLEKKEKKEKEKEKSPLGKAPVCSGDGVLQPVEKAELVMVRSKWDFLIFLPKIVSVVCMLLR